MTLRIRDRIRSVAGDFDEADGRPFVLGKAMRISRYAKVTTYTFSGDGVCDHVDVTAIGAETIRIWLACIQMPDGTWRDDYAFTDDEVFEPIPRRC